MSEQAGLELNSHCDEQEWAHLVSQLDEATECTRLANLYFFKRDYINAERLYWKALAIMKESFGSKNLAVANCLDDLADLYEVQEDYQQAGRLLEMALVIREHVLGPKNLLVMRNLKRLHSFYNQPICGFIPVLERVS
jgi:tetratricopeptide (TPR) repeat protein